MANSKGTFIGPKGQRKAFVFGTQPPGWTLEQHAPGSAAANPGAGADTGMADPYSQQLTDINSQIATTNTSLSAFDDPTSYLSLLQKVGDASYQNNQDTIAYRQSARAQLYGNQTPYKPENFNQLSPDQQTAIKNAPRAGLVAGIQASQETENARKNSLTDLLSVEAGRYNDQRTSLTAHVNQLISRRSELEGQQNAAKEANRTLFFSMVKDYPDLVKNLTPQEQQQLFNGNPNKDLINKVASYAQKAEAKSNYKTVEKNGFITTYDPTSGKIINKIDLGSQFRDKVSGGGGSTAGLTDWQIMQRSIPKGYDVKLQTNGPGVDFYGPKGKISPQDWANATNIDWHLAAQARGSENQADWAGTTQGARINADQAATDKTYINTQIAVLKKGGSTNTQISQYIRDQGYEPKDFGYK